MENKKKVVFTYVEAGLGHIVPINSIASAFEKKYGNEFEIVRSYIFEESKSKFVNKMGEECIIHTKKLANNKVYKFFEGLSQEFSSKTTHKFLDRHFRKGIADFFVDIKTLNPDLIVSSYYLPSYLTTKANKLGLTDSLVATYSPDPFIYPAWDKDCDLFLVNNINAYNMALKKGFDKDIVKRTPFVLSDKIINTNLDKKTAREKLGLDEKFTLLFTSGAYGANKTIKVIKEIIKQNLDINFVVICGKNDDLKEKVNSLKQNFSGKTNIQVVGFTDRLNEYMVASNLAIGKGGSNTLMESIFLSCPMVVIAEASRLETETAKFWEKQGLLIRQRNSKKIIKLINKCIQDKGFLENIIEKSKEYKQIDGAEICADTLYQLITNNTDRKVKKWKYLKNLKNVG